MASFLDDRDEDREKCDYLAPFLVSNHSRVLLFRCSRVILFLVWRAKANLKFRPIGICTRCCSQYRKIHRPIVSLMVVMSRSSLHLPAYLQATISWTVIITPLLPGDWIPDIRTISTVALYKTRRDYFLEICNAGKPNLKHILWSHLVSPKRNKKCINAVCAVIFFTPKRLQQLN